MIGVGAATMLDVDEMAPMPPFAAWRHRDAREGFEVAFFQAKGAGMRVEGCTTAIQDGVAFAVRYAIEVDEGWRTRRARVWGHSPGGAGAVDLEADADGRWLVDGARAAHLQDCRDVDLELSAFTNSLPVRRLRLAPGEEAEAPAAYVRALDLGVERLEQRYLRGGETSEQRYEYSAPAFEFRCMLSYDGAGLVLDYPGIATRAAPA